MSTLYEIYGLVKPKPKEEPIKEPIKQDKDFDKSFILHKTPSMDTLILNDFTRSLNFNFSNKNSEDTYLLKSPFVSEMDLRSNSSLDTATIKSFSRLSQASFDDDLMIKSPLSQAVNNEDEMISSLIGIDPIINEHSPIESKNVQIDEPKIVTMEKKTEIEQQKDLKTNELDKKSKEIENVAKDIQIQPKESAIQSWLNYQVEITKEYSYLGVEAINPNDYVSKFGEGLIQPNELPKKLFSFKAADGSILEISDSFNALSSADLMTSALLDYEPILYF
jgi:hypothetical protein